MSFKKDLSKFSPRKEQKEALDFIDREYKSNPINLNILNACFLFSKIENILKSFKNFI